MAESVPIAQLRRRILKNKDIVLAKHTKQPIRIADLPDAYVKTSEMKYLEQKYQLHLEQLLFKGSLSDSCKALHYEVDRSTLSRWRKYIKSQLGIIEYYGNNKEQ